MGDVWTAIGAIGAFIAAIAASFAGLFTYRIMQAGQKQVELARIQNQQTLESERDAQLPVLMPTKSIESAGYAEKGPGGESIQHAQLGYDRAFRFARVEIANVGPGLALNVCGVLFEPRPDAEVHRTTGQYHFHRYDKPFTPGAPPITMDWTGSGLPFVGDVTLDTDGRYTLYAASTPRPGNLFHGAPQMNARLTLTYSDIFGRRHAAIYDLTAQWEWINVAYLRNIPRGLDEIIHDALKNVHVLVSPGLPTTND